MCTIVQIDEATEMHTANGCTVQNLLQIFFRRS